MKPPDRHLIAAFAATPLLLLTLSMVARTEAFLGPKLRAEVERRAAAMGADVEILTVAPAGLWGLKLEQVAVRIPRGGFAVEADLESVKVYPTLTSLLSGNPVIDEIELEGGTIGLRPWALRPKPRPMPSTTAERQPSAPAPRALDRPIRIELAQVDVVAFSERYRTQRLHLERLELDVVRGKGVLESAGYGRLPDGIAFKVATPDEGRLAIEPERRTHVERWAEPLPGGAPWPISISTTRLEVCARTGCKSLVELDDVEIAVPVWRDDVRITAPFSSVSREHKELALSAPEMSIVDSATRDFAARLTEIDVRYTLDSGELSGLVQLADPRGGTLDVDWRFDAQDFDVAFRAKNFDAPSVWHLVPYGSKLRPDRVDGTLHTKYDLAHSTLGVEADLRFDRISAWFPVTRESFDASELRFELDAYADLDQRAISINRAAFWFGEARPLVARAELVHANRGWAFDTRLRLERQDVNALLGRLPPQFGAVADGAVLEGEVGFALAARGHSAYPDSLVLEGELDSNVEVLEEAPATDPRKLGRQGPPPQLAGESWVGWSRLPRHAVDAILAAEDARFFQHDGFDTIGFEAAMRHNLRERRLDRGGSTISQQVAKNLWLSGERTIARKLEEAYLTWRLESLHPKRRILEIYLNLADWGPGTKGIAAASHLYFGVDPHQLSTAEVALLAAILPNPTRFGGWIRKGYIAASRLEKVEHTLRNLRFMDKIRPEDYRRLWARARDQGRIGRLTLELCDDEGGPSSAPKCKDL